MKSPAAIKLIIEDWERLDRERGELVDYRDRFYAADKQVAVLQARLKPSVAFEILSSSCLVIGAAAIGYARMLWQNPPDGYIAVIFGAVLIIGGILAKAVKS